MDTDTQKKTRRKKVIIVSLLVALALYIIAGFAVTRALMDEYFAHSDKRAYFSFWMTYDDVEHEFLRNQIEFYSGENKLTGAIYGSTNAKGLVVIVHGFGGCADIYMPQIQYFVRQNWCVLAYDGTGVNDSGGERRGNLYQAVYDLRSALTYINGNEELSGLPITLFGHSQGGFAVCSVLNDEESSDVKAVVSVAGMNNTGDSVDVVGRSTAGAFYPLLKPFVLLMDHADFSIGRERNAVNGINNSDIPVMLIQGDKDETVPADKVAITSFTDSIKNPNVETIILSEEWNSGHNSVLWSKSAYEHRAEADASIEAYMQRKSIEVLIDSDLRAWAATFNLDRTKMNAVNEGLFGVIEKFLSEAIRK